MAKGLVWAGMADSRCTAPPTNSICSWTSTSNSNASSSDTAASIEEAGSRLEPLRWTPWLRRANAARERVANRHEERQLAGSVSDFRADGTAVAGREKRYPRARAWHQPSSTTHGVLLRLAHRHFQQPPRTLLVPMPGLRTEVASFFLRLANVSTAERAFRRAPLGAFLNVR